MAWAARYIEESIRGIQSGTAAFASTPGAFTSLMARDIGFPEATYEMLKRELQKPAAMRGPEPAVLGPMGGKINFKLMMRGGKLAGGTAGTSEFIGLAKYAGLTLHHGAAGSSKVTGGSTSTLEAASGDVSSYAVGDFILFKHSTYVSLRQITGIAGTTTKTLTFSPTVVAGAAPANGDSFYPVDTLVPNPGSPAYYHGFNVFLGEGSTDRHKTQLLGCAGTFKFPACKAGDIPLVEFDFMADRFSVSEASQAQDADTYSEPIPLLAENFMLDNDTVEIESIAFDLGTKVVEKPGITGGTQGRIGWFYRDHEPKIVIVPYWDAEWQALMAAKTQKKLHFSSVNSELQAWGYSCPAVQVVGVGHGTIGGAMVSATPTLEVLDPHNNSDSPAVALPRFAIGVSSV